MHLAGSPGITRTHVHDADAAAADDDDDVITVQHMVLHSWTPLDCSCSTIMSKNVSDLASSVKALRIFSLPALLAAGAVEENN